MDSTVNPTPPLAALGRTDRTVLGAAGAVVVGAVAGIIVGAWDVQPFALVMIVLGLIVGGVTYGLAAMDVAPAVRPYLPAARRVAASVAAAIAALAFVEFLGDLDDLEDTGGFVGLAIALVVALGAAAMVALTVRHEDVRIPAIARGTRLAALGAGLVLGAWLIHLTVGFWSFGPAVWGIAAIVPAVALLVFGSTDERTAARLGWVAAGLGAFTALTALGQWSELMRLGETRLELGPADILPFLVYAAGIVLVIAGGLVQASGGRLPIPASMPAGEGASS